MKPENCCNRCLVDHANRAAKAPAGQGAAMEMRDAFLVHVHDVPALLCGPCIGALHRAAAYTRSAFLHWLLNPTTGCSAPHDMATTS